MRRIANLFIIVIGCLLLNGISKAESNRQNSQPISDQLEATVVSQIDSFDQKMNIETGFLVDSCDGQHPGDPNGDGVIDLSDFAII